MQIDIFSRCFARGIASARAFVRLSLLAAVSLVGAMASPIAVADDGLLGEIAQARAGMREAVVKADRTLLASLLTEQFVYVHSTGQVNGRDERLTSLLTGRAMETQPEEQIEARRLDNRTSVVWGKTRMPARGNNEAFVLKWNSVYVMEDGKWRVAYVQSWRP